MSKRAVRQYNRNGKFIAEYATIRAASDSTGVLGASISFACCGKYKTAGNYIWRYADEVTSELEMEAVQSLLSFQDEFPELIKEWSLGNPSAPDQYAPHSGKKVLWICPVGHPDYLMSLNRRTLGQGCPICARLRKRKGVCQYSRSGKLIKEYASAIKASEEIGLYQGRIGTACRKKKQTAGKFYWRFADEASGNGGDEVPPGLPKSFLSEYPELAKDWSPENPVGPDEVYPHATAKVLWICPEGHPDYWMSVLSRSEGLGCPVCGRLRMERYWKSISKPVYQMKMNGTIIAEYPSMRAAERETEILASSISLACMGKHGSAGGFRWCYAPKEAEAP